MTRKKEETDEFFFSISIWHPFWTLLICGLWGGALALLVLAGLLQ